ncbi:hypothetical protein CR205_05850 [Alteribacter lacisalsi]|uniref:PepSY domain-containing protein n=1 Tax=Alteribacter lacisalsi TaxID=2045244 RepID=A0A2W0HWL6_9BACI|nr:PepSY domain-containing protein [Alteribacter lacisalsi]PYZ98118.1 hypothetical protein CR205_05850 [Alteribacter lacisalsi]
MKYKLMISITAVTLLAAAGVFFLQSQAGGTLAEAEIAGMLEERYDGTISDIRSGEEAGEQVYHAELSTREGGYYLLVNAITGEIIDMELLEINMDEENREREVLEVDEVRRRVLETLDEEAEVLEIERNDDDGRPVYHVTVAEEGGTGMFELDAVTGDILSYTVEEENQQAEGPISEQEAINIALNEFQGEVDDVDLEQKDGRLVYEIEIENDSTGIEADFIIDAYTGEILSIEYDD